MRAAVDVMGGDHAPQAILDGCWQAAPLLDEKDSILLCGDAKIIESALAAANLPPEQKSLFKIIPCGESIGMDESPVEAVRAKPQSSINVMCKLASAGEADAVISAGNTGAVVAAAQLRMRTLPGISRPGIAVVFPTFHGPVVICDCGANPLPKPKHMKEYGLMAAAYSTAVCGVANPKVGLLSIGEEESKGTLAIKQANQVMADDPVLNFKGNVEGRDLFKGVVDVVVCDGFVGNVLLKFFEGTVEGLFKEMMIALKQTTPDLIERIAPVMKKVQAELDWRDYGGAPLLGVSGICLICHGRSDSRAIKSAIRIAKKLSTSGINQKIVEKLKQCKQVEEQMSDYSAIITGTGSSLPEKRLTNDDLSKLVDTNDEWIVQRTGIRERRIASEGESTATLAIAAAKKAIAAAGIQPSDLDLIICATITPEMVFPNTGCFVAAALGLTSTPAFDIEAACSGFIYALSTGAAFIKSGQYKNVLIIGAETLSRITDYKDRGSCILFGDGAGAVVLQRSTDLSRGVLYSQLYADGNGVEAMKCLPGSLHPISQEMVDNRQQYMQIKGREVYKFAVTKFEELIQQAMRACELTPQTLKLIVPHQVNQRIIDHAMEKLGLGADKAFVNIDRYGNTSAASIPIALDEAWRQGKLSKGDAVIFVAFGAGLTWATAVVRI